MSGSDRTEKPTPKRRREARREGRIARTPDVAAWLGVLAASYVVPLAGGIAGRRIRELLEHASRAATTAEPSAATAILAEGLRTTAVAIAPVCLGVMVVGVGANLAQVGFAPSTKVLRPKLERVNPLAGVRRLLQPSSLWEAAKSCVKLALLAVLGYRSVAGIVPRLVGGGAMPLDAIVAIVAGEAIALARRVAVLGLALAAADYGFQRRRVAKGMAMTKQEVKDEHRQSEGDPQLRGAIRSRQLAMSRNRMMAAVADADVVVVNPVHVAVALRYVPSKGAPRVVAKGAGAIAARIREEAERHRVPMVEDIPLARTLHRACELGDEVPPELYDAVARLLAFIFAVRAGGSAAAIATGIHRLPAPLLA